MEDLVKAKEKANDNLSRHLDMCTICTDFDQDMCDFGEHLWRKYMIAYGNLSAAIDRKVGEVF